MKNVIRIEREREELNEQKRALSLKATTKVYSRLRNFCRHVLFLGTCNIK